MCKRKLSFLFIFLVMFALVSCNNPNQNEEKQGENEVSTSQFEEKALKINYLEEKKDFSSYEFDLYKDANIDKEKNEISILDSNKNKILFSVDSNRQDKQPGWEGIYSKTDALYVYDMNNKSFDVVGEFKGYYIIYGYLVDEKYIALGIKLGEGDKDYSIFYGDKGDLNEIYKGKNIWTYTLWPSLIKTDTAIMLLEPQIEQGKDDDIITGVNLLKLNNTNFEKVNLQVPSDFEILSTDTRSDGGLFVNYWENKKDENAYFFLMDENGLKKIIPFPNKYRLLNFALSKNKLVATVQVGEEWSHKILVFDLDNDLLYSSGFDYVVPMMTLSSDGKIIYEKDGKLSLLEFKNNELNVERVNVDETTEILLTSGIRFTNSEDKIILTSYGDAKKFVVLENK